MLTRQPGDSLTACRLATSTVIYLLVRLTACSEESLMSVTVDNTVFTYRISRMKSSWNESDSRCRDLDRDSYLAILDNTQQVSQMKRILNYTTLWIGGHQNESDSYWMWLDGKTLDKPPGSGSCLAIDNRVITAIPCDTKSRYYICSFNASSCPSEGKILYNTTAECTKVFNVNDKMPMITWAEANYDCSSRKGILAVIIKENITVWYNKTYIGGELYQKWWWAYNTDKGIKPISMDVNAAKPRNQCLVITKRGIMADDCMEQHFVLCEVPPPSERTVYLILGVMTALFIILALIITWIVWRKRRLRKAKSNSQPNDTQTQPHDVIYLEALPVNPDAEPETIDLQTAHRKAQPSRHPPVSPYAMRRIESIIERERYDNVIATGSNQDGSR